MAQVQWKEISSNLSGSHGFTGSFKVSGSIVLNGIDIGVSVDPSIFRKTGSYYNATSNIGVTGSFQLNFPSASDYFSINYSGSQVLKVTPDGVLQLASQSLTPTAVAGGLFYSASDSFYLGFES